jgi:DNA-directed RNA polymerase beta' subunit
MTTIKINERTKTGKAFMAMFEAFFKGVDGIEIIETDSKKLKKEDSIYSPEFVAKIKKAEENIKKGKTTRLNPEDIWGSIL